MIRIKLREIAWEEEITAVEISRQTGIDPSTLSAIMKRRRTNVELDTINKLCKFFDCKISDILEYIPDP